jgi:predicted HNH restriction endonuclease
MTRKKFIEAQGATCDNWIWSWSFINPQEKVIIFGAWDTQTDGNIAVILSERWQTGDTGSKKAGYAQSRDHIRLIEEQVDKHCGKGLLTWERRAASITQGTLFSPKDYDGEPKPQLPPGP